MGLPQKSLAYITPAEYLVLEAVAREKHEDLDGRIYSWQGDGPNGMVGTPLAHNRVGINILVALLAQKPGTDCEVMMSDVRVAPKGDSTYFYPDAMVRCGPRLPGDVMEIDGACLIVEALSDSTEAFDRGEKFADTGACRRWRPMSWSAPGARLPRCSSAPTAGSAGLSRRRGRSACGEVG